MIKLLEQLKRHEGFRPAAYHDSLGFLTIGYGRMIDVRRQGGISEDEAAVLLANDIARVDKALGSWLLDEPVRRAALLNMAFQLGVDGLFRFKNMFAAIERRDWEAAAAAGLDSKWAKQTPARAKELMEQLRTGRWRDG